MTWIVFCNTPSGETHQEKCKSTTHMIYEHQLHYIVMLQLHSDYSSLSMLQRIIVLPSNFGVTVRMALHLICFFVYLCLCFPLVYSCWVCLCCTSGPAHHSPGICPSPSALGPQSAGTTLLNLRPLQHFHPACLCMCLLVFVFTRSPIELLLGT